MSGHSREETMAFDDPKQVMQDFAVWVKERSKRRPLFISDNNGFDWQFINWYFWHFTDGNPFGHTSTNLGSLYKGLVQDTFQNFKHLRKTAHTHHPVDDAKGNAEALLEMKGWALRFHSRRTACQGRFVQRRSHALLRWPQRCAASPLAAGQ